MNAIAGEGAMGVSRHNAALDSAGATAAVLRPTMQIHATCCALDGPAGPAGVLLLGPPGSGKSDLALRLVDAGFLLVADDRVDMDGSGIAPVAAAPATLAGLIEVRGMGIIRLARHMPRAAIVLAVTLAPAVEQERLPETMTTALAGHAVPTIPVDPTCPGAVARIRLALAVLAGEAESRCGALGPASAGALARQVSS
jgi:serine kinase of HPr protein (carbohydrate metabolism regulator)